MQRTTRALFLGTAQDAGLPQVGCACSNCRSVRSGGRQPEGASCVALVDDASREFWLLDATPDFPRQYDDLMRELGGTHRLGGIVLTHAHVGHYLGLVYLGREAMGAKGVPVICSPSLALFLGENAPFSQLIALSNISLHPLEPGTPLHLGSHMTIEFWPVPHRNEFSDTVAVVAQGPERSLLYLPDIDRWEDWDRSLPEVLRQVDVALLDGTFFDDDELPNRPRAEIPHPTVRDTMSRLQTLESGLRSRVHFTHLNHSNPLWDQAFARRVEAEGFRVARRGHAFEL